MGTLPVLDQGVDHLEVIHGGTNVTRTAFKQTIFKSIWFREGSFSLRLTHITVHVKSMTIMMIFRGSVFQDCHRS